MTFLAMAGVILSSGCAVTPALVRPVREPAPLPSTAGAEAAASPRPPKRDVDVVRAQAPGPTEDAPPPPPLSALPTPAVGDDAEGGELYQYDPMRGAALSPEPPTGRGITLRELLGLGRSEIADMEVEARPDYPDLHSDPLARSRVPPSERDRPLFPWLSNLIFEHDHELSEDDADARDSVMRRRSRYDVTNPGPDTANFPNSAFTLPKGRMYIENSPLAFFGKSRSFPAQYNWEFLIRYGLTDDLEFRLFSGGFAATLSRPYTTGFSPLTFDVKYHLWDENVEKHIPAAGLETYIQTSFGSNFFTGGTQPSLLLLLDHTLPHEFLFEHNFGLTGIQDTFGSSVYEFSYQWALQRAVFKDFAIFTHGFLNSAALPRLPIFQRHIRADALTNAVPQAIFPYASRHLPTPAALVVGGGFLWNLSRRLSVYGSYNAGLAADSPRIIALLGFAVAL